jgi:predicted PurR-regulated permease PerM
MTAHRRSSSPLFTLAAIVTAVAALHLAREILLPLALATLISFLLEPLAERLERWGLGRLPSVLAVAGVAFLALGLLGWVVTSQLIDLSGRLPEYKDNIVAKVRAVTHGSSTFSDVAATLEDIGNELAEKGPDDSAAADKNQRGEPLGGDLANGNGDAPERSTGQPASAPTSDAIASERFAGRLSESFADQRRGDEDAAVAVKVVSLPPTPVAQVRAWLGPLVAPLTMAGMVVVIVLFMLLQREDQRNRLIRLFGTSNIHATTEALTDIVNRVSRYLRMQFLINASYGLCVGAGLAAIGLPNAVMWGVLSFSLRFLPYIGPWISAVLPFVVSIADSEGWTQPLMVVGLFIILELIVNNVAEPLLYGSSIGVSGLGVILAAIFWTWLWGAIGLVLAMPLTVCLVVMARYVPALRFITVLLGDEPMLSLEERVYQRMLAFDDVELRGLTNRYLDNAAHAELYDRVLLPALRLAEQDRHAGVLSDEEDEAVQEAARELIAEVDAAAEGAADSQPPPPPDQAEALPDEAPKTRVLCIPLRSESDKTAALMLGQLLEDAGMQPIVGAVESLTGELVESVESLAANLVVISILPPQPLNRSRLLARRLRSRRPDLPIVVGYWDGSTSEDSRRQLAAIADGDIVTTLAEAVARARAISSRAAARVVDEAASFVTDDNEHSWAGASPTGRRRAPR